MKSKVQEKETINDDQFSISIPSDKNNRQFVATQSTEIRIPDQYLSDSFVCIRQSELEKARAILEKESTSNKRAFLEEASLALSTTLLGVTLSSVASGVQITTAYGVIVYTFLPMLTVALFAMYYTLRSKRNLTSKDAAKRALDYLADPATATTGKNPHEHR